MPKLDLISDVRRRLLRKGLGRAYVNRTASELREHWLDLVDEGQRQGLSRMDAKARADERLGTAERLSEELCARMQSVSWLSRHPLAAFTGLTLLATLIWWGTLMLAVGGATGILTWNPDLPRSAPPSLDVVRTCADWIRLGSYLAVPWMVCLVAQRYFCGWKPALWGCLLASIHNGAHKLLIAGEGPHGTIAWQYQMGFEGPDLAPILVPLVVFAIFWSLNLGAVSGAESKEPEQLI